MARNYGQPINLQQNELQNATIQNLAADPTSPAPKKGQIYFNTTTNKKRTFNGTTWDEDTFNAGTTGVTQTTTSGAGGRVKVSGGADRTVVDYSGGAGLLKTTDANGTLATAAAGTDYVTAGSTNTFTNKTLDATGTGNTVSNLATTNFASGVVVSTVTSGSTNSQLPTALAVYNAIQTGFATNDALLYKGGIDASTNPNYPAADAGFVYKITAAGLIGGASGVAVTVGDTLICNVDSSAAGTQAAVGANWTIVQSNVDAATTTTQGLTVYATQAETEARSLSTKTVTPAGLANFPRIQTFVVGDGTATSFALTHNNGRAAVICQVYETSSGNIVEVDVTARSTTSLTIAYSPAPASGALTAIVMG